MKQNHTKVPWKVSLEPTIEDGLTSYHVFAPGGYVIAKTGVILYTKAIAKRFAASGITANVVAPGVAENSVSKPLHEIPMGRLALLQEIAQAVLFFVREPYLTGQVLEVAGGWNL